MTIFLKSHRWKRKVNYKFRNWKAFNKKDAIVKCDRGLKTSDLGDSEKTKILHSRKERFKGILNLKYSIQYVK